ncbi:hypothetical protein PSTG_10017 [Puccinia striiformis f. sp. tritici PST-78]|uniref:Uncharacterized protein n=1 Tax=Puccinia striiformis f. sp. tritici PST-78 TaxID=1165861 RepID=A0A0L0VCM7_9BASI|nr:hypothetical protein PSTG_10017 [Puccinia striiformis f. sp. tritici PST-78]
MDMAVEGAKDLELILKNSAASLKPKHTFAPPPPLYHHADSSQQASNAMDVDATTFYPNCCPLAPFEILVEWVCLAQRYAFEEKQKFVEQYQSAPPVPVAIATTDAAAPSPLVLLGPDLHPQPGLAPPKPAPAVYGSEEVYNEFIKSHLATVEVRLNISRTGRIMVPVLFQVSPTRLVVTLVLVDTGVMANFVNKKFIDDNQLPTHIHCIGFDSNKGVRDTVTHDWVG